MSTRRARRRRTIRRFDPGQLGRAKEDQKALDISPFGSMIASLFLNLDSDP